MECYLAFGLAIAHVLSGHRIGQAAVSPIGSAREIRRGPAESSRHPHDVRKRGASTLRKTSQARGTDSANFIGNLLPADSTLAAPRVERGVERANVEFAGGPLPVSEGDRQRRPSDTAQVSAKLRTESVTNPPAPVIVLNLLSER